MFIGVGTVTNVVTVVIGSLLGLWLGDRFAERTRLLLTQMLGLFTFVIAALSAVKVTSDELAQASAGAGMLVVLGSLMIGSLIGSWLHLEQRLNDFAGWLQTRMKGKSEEKDRFVNGFVTATLVFCVGPLTIVGSLSDGLGQGADQLIIKAVMDGFAAIAFASALGVGVLVSALAVGVIQGSLTLLGVLLGSFLSTAQVDALTATGGVILLAVGVRLLDIVDIKIANALPALIIAPLATGIMQMVL